MCGSIAAAAAAASFQSCSASRLPPRNNILHTKHVLPKPISPGILRRNSPPRILNLKCRCNNGGNGDETRTVLDAFFLGKAFAEAFSERVESAVGEFLSTVGRWEAEQQKQIQEFQEQVVEKARRAQEQAARETLKEKGSITTTTATYSDASVTDSSLINDDPSSEIPNQD